MRAKGKGAVRGTRKPLHRPFDWFVEPSGPTNKCNRRANSKNYRKTAIFYNLTHNGAQASVKNSDRLSVIGLGAVAARRGGTSGLW